MTDKSGTSSAFNTTGASVIECGVSEYSPGKIEVTPEMIEAGVAIFCAHDSRFFSDEEAVRQIFEAMVEVSRLRPREEAQNYLDDDIAPFTQECIDLGLPQHADGVALICVAQRRLSLD